MAGPQGLHFPLFIGVISSSERAPKAPEEPQISFSFGPGDTDSPVYCPGSGTVKKNNGIIGLKLRMNMLLWSGGGLVRPRRQAD